MLKRLIRELPLHLMLLPGVIIVAIYCYIPMFGIAIAFEDFLPNLGIFRSKWVGFDNFQYLFSMPNTLRVIWNTFYIAIMKVTANIVVPLILALLLNEVRKTSFKRSVQTIIYVPHFMSWVIMAGIIIDIMSPSKGIINQIIVSLGFEPVFFLGSNQWFPFVLVITESWKEAGFGTIIFMAALAGIDPGLYEAAIVDGAGRLKQTLHITIPSIMYIVLLLMTLSLGGVLNNSFEQVFNLYSPLVYKSGDIIDTLVYRIGLGDGRYGLATALGLFKSVVSFVLLTISYRLSYVFSGYKIF